MSNDEWTDTEWLAEQIAYSVGMDFSMYPYRGFTCSPIRERGDLPFPNCVYTFDVLVPNGELFEVIVHQKENG